MRALHLSLLLCTVACAWASAKYEVQEGPLCRGSLFQLPAAELVALVSNVEALTSHVIVDVHEIPGGLSNRNFRLSTASGETFLYRVSGDRCLPDSQNYGEGEWCGGVCLECRVTCVFVSAPVHSVNRTVEHACAKVCYVCGAPLCPSDAVGVGVLAPCRPLLPRGSLQRWCTTTRRRAQC